MDNRILELLNVFLDSSKEEFNLMCTIIEKNYYGEKKVIHGKNLHHIVPKFYWRKNNLDIDNSPENLVSLTIGEHFLVHYYMDACRKTGWGTYTNPAWRYILKTHPTPLNKWVGESKDNAQKMAEILDQYDQNIIGAMKGKHHTKEAKEKISKASKGRKHKQETKRKISEAFKGKKRPKEVGENISKAKKGKKLSEETKLKRCLAGRPR